MSRITVAHLLERIESLEAEVEALRESAHTTNPVQFVRELTAPAPVSVAMDIRQLHEENVWYHAHYDESTGWGANTYL